MDADAAGRQATTETSQQLMLFSQTIWHNASNEYDKRCHQNLTPENKNLDNL
jgi:hypothetical protein